MDSIASANGLKTQIDHIVVVAQTLEQGVTWCEATLGITPQPGGDHPQFGTHNRIFKIATPNFPLAYFEIIAIKKIAAQALNTPLNGKNELKKSRWFDMDDAALQAAEADAAVMNRFYPTPWQSKYANGSKENTPSIPRA